jgi:hypothetical protein
LTTPQADPDVNVDIRAVGTSVGLGEVDQCELPVIDIIVVYHEPKAILVREL